jgi:hypothetical protein
VAAKQTRRSISVRGTTYENLRRYCAEQDISMSELVEEPIARVLTRTSSKGRPEPVPYDKVVAPRMARAPKGDYRTIRF